MVRARDFGAQPAIAAPCRQIGRCGDQSLTIALATQLRRHDHPVQHHIRSGRPAAIQLAGQPDRAPAHATPDGAKVFNRAIQKPPGFVANPGQCCQIPVRGQSDQSHLWAQCVPDQAFAATGCHPKGQDLGAERLPVK